MSRTNSRASGTNMNPAKATFGGIVPNPKLKLLDQVR